MEEASKATRGTWGAPKTEKKDESAEGAKKGNGDKAAKGEKSDKGEKGEKSDKPEKKAKADHHDGEKKGRRAGCRVTPWHGDVTKRATETSPRASKLEG